MPTLDIQGRKVEVDDGFLQLSPEEQGRTVDEIASNIGIKPAEASKAPEERSTLRSVDDRARALVRGLPVVGKYADEFAAGMNTGFGFLGDYDKALKAENERDAAHQRDYPREATKGEIIGAVSGTVAALPLAAGRIPATMLGKMATSTGIGTGIGFTEGFGRGEGGAKNRLKSAKEDAAVGAAVGVLAPGVGYSLGKTAKWGYEAWRRMAQKVAGNPPEQRKTIINTLRQLEASGLSMADAERKLTELGPEGMLADVSPAMQQRTGQLSAKIPEAAQIAGTRLATRRKAGGQRMEDVLDTAFGPKADPYAMKQAQKAASAASAPEYRAAHAQQYDPSSVIQQVDSTLADLAEKDPVAGRLRTLRDILSDPATATGKGGHRARMFLDMELRKIDENAPDSLTRIFRGDITDLRRNLDANLKGQIPDFVPADARVSDAAKQTDAFNYGRKELMKGGADTPSPMAAAARLRAMAPPERQSARQGVRFELDRQTSNVRRNPALTAENVLTRDFNDDKTRLLIGRQKADRLSRDLETEKTFTETSNMAEPGRGSRTAMITPNRPVSADFSDVAVTATAGGIYGGGAGIVAGGVAGLLNRLGKRGLRELAERTERVLGKAEAELLTATGPGRDKIVRELGRVAGELRKKGEIEAAASILGFSFTAANANDAPVPQALRPYLGR